LYRFDLLGTTINSAAPLSSSECPMLKLDPEKREGLNWCKLQDASI
jgi:hypothetical protein